jgi:hypothetical protein
VCLSKGNLVSQNDELSIQSKEDKLGALDEGAQDNLESERNGREEDNVQKVED